MANSKSTRLQVSSLPKCLKFLPKSYHTPEYINDNTEIEGCEIIKVCQSTLMFRLLVALKYSAYQSGTHLNFLLSKWDSIRQYCYQNGTQLVCIPENGTQLTGTGYNSLNVKTLGYSLHITNLIDLLTHLFTEQSKYVLIIQNTLQTS